MADWTPEEDARLEEFWNMVPEISTDEIGRRMLRSKNSIVGRGHRLGLPGRLSPNLRGGRPKTTSGPTKNHILPGHYSRPKVTLPPLPTASEPVRPPALPARTPYRGVGALATAVAHSVPRPVIVAHTRPVEAAPTRYRRVIECQWVTERGPFLWDRCEEKTLPGKSYCAKHIVGLSYRVRDRSADVAAQFAGDD